MRYTTTTISEVLARRERSQSWLARKMRVSPALITRVLSGERAITAEFVRRACDVLDLPEGALFSYEPTMRMRTNIDAEEASHVA